MIEQDAAAEMVMGNTSNQHLGRNHSMILGKHAATDNPFQNIAIDSTKSLIPKINQ